MIDAIDREEMNRKLFKLKLAMKQRRNDSAYNRGYTDAVSDAINKAGECTSLELTAIVRCKDCHHATERFSTMPFCTIHNRRRGADDYCNFGEIDIEQRREKK